MKRYNLSPIMRNAHQLYKNARAKYPTFSDALKRSWKSAKFNVQVTESIKAIDAEKETQKESPFYAFNVFVVNAYTYKSYRCRERNTKSKRTTHERQDSSTKARCYIQ